jgi:hypothetical protein
MSSGWPKSGRIRDTAFAIAEDELCKILVRLRRILMLKDAALCLFLWDLADEGIGNVLRFAADAGRDRGN